MCEDRDVTQYLAGYLQTSADPVKEYMVLVFYAKNKTKLQQFLDI